MSLRAAALVLAGALQTNVIDERHCTSGTSVSPHQLRCAVGAACIHASAGRGRPPRLRVADQAACGGRILSTRACRAGPASGFSLASKPSSSFRSSHAAEDLQE